ncbi:SKP1-like protein 1B [Macadamia integrifolia]|uniref:SKP1-like protein 1B n=1 Tax=Macadamia integrifolia TaxID=60698 RepID=UPI001C4F9336|nr:SKP1-like protein 1B [Macadamia integrifolia]
MASAKVFVLRTCDGETFEIDESVAYVSETIKNMIEDGFGHDLIPLPNVSSKILLKVIEYCRKHVSNFESSKKTSNGDEKDKDNDSWKKEKEAVPEVEKDAEEKARVEELKEWETTFIDIDQQVLFDLLQAANYLNIKGLLVMAAEKAASMIRGKTPEQIRETFNIKNDFTPEEYEDIRKKDAMNDFTPEEYEEIRKKIADNHFTPEEYEQIRKENAWAIE